VEKSISPNLFMKKIFGLSFLLTGILLSSYAQLKSVKGYCGLYYKNMESLHHQQGTTLAFYNFLPGQVVASIGAQCCHWEAAYAATVDSVHFYLEDIDSSYLNDHQANFAWGYYDSLRGKPMTSKYQLVLGDEKKTSLPDKTFDKILIINSFHEFGYPKEMLGDILTKLKPGGILYIDETIARKSGELHGVCKKRIYLPEELIEVLNQAGFQFVDALDLQFRKKQPVRKIFAFALEKPT
jgi:SAM-dependent methyltransferase